MFEAANLTGVQEEAIKKHLVSHFGRKAFASRAKTRMFCEDHSKVMTDKTEFEYEKGERPETVEYSYKDIPVEIAKQMTTRLNAALVNGNRINLNDYEFKGSDFIFGADHGQGAFQVGAKVVLNFDRRETAPNGGLRMPKISVPTPKSRREQEESIVFEVSLAEVICRKDTSALIQATIGDYMKSGFKIIADSTLTIGQDESGNIICSFDALSDEYKRKDTPLTSMYVTGDLAFYAMVLGRESSSGTRCFICRMSAREFSASLRKGDPWTYELMNTCVEELDAQKARGKKTTSVEGCKEKAWWQMIPLENYLVPLLHTLIGIGNDVFDNFRDIINRDIECLDPKEIVTRQKVVACENQIQADVSRRDEWDNSAKGKQLKSLEAILEELDDYVDQQDENDDENNSHDEDLDDEDELILPGNVTVNAAAADQSQNSFTPVINTKIATLKAEIEAKNKELVPLSTERKVLANNITKGRAILTRLKNKLTEFRSLRKKSKDGYLSFVKAAGEVHVSLGCSVTHKVHLMMCHVADQMRYVPGGLGEKMEDWVELMHQIGARARRRFRTTKDLAMRAKARARAEQRSMNADLLERQNEVKLEHAKKPKEDGTKMEDEQQKIREKVRLDALIDYKIHRGRALNVVKGAITTRNEIPFLFPGIPPDSLTSLHLQRIPLLLIRGKVTA
eukprot:scaffold123208_cov22-Cyclotella_meneghiniana.AAC.1